MLIVITHQTSISPPVTQLINASYYSLLALRARGKCSRYNVVRIVMYTTILTYTINCEFIITFYTSLLHYNSTRNSTITVL